ncbi:hypothetical protein D3C73_647410 [compost metagenome]
MEGRAVFPDQIAAGSFRMGVGDHLEIGRAGFSMCPVKQRKVLHRVGNDASGDEGGACRIFRSMRVPGLDIAAGGSEAGAQRFCSAQGHLPRCLRSGQFPIGHAVQ